MKILNKHVFRVGIGLVAGWVIMAQMGAGAAEAKQEAEAGGGEAQGNGGRSNVFDPATADSSVAAGTNGVVRPPAPQSLAELQAANPFLKLRPGPNGQVLLDYQYRSPATNAAAAAMEPAIQIHERGSTARNGKHTAEFDGNLNRQDSIVLRFPENQILQARPAALSISDGAGRRIWLGELKDCEGQVLEDSGQQARVLYRDAFAGISADVRYTYHLNFFEQNIILREQPDTSKIDEETAVLQVWTEVFRAPEAIKSINKVVFREAGKGAGQKEILADDETVDFGSMRIVGGQAFETPGVLGGPGEEPGGNAVIKQWVREGQRTFLVENVDYLSVKPALAKLDRRQAKAGPVTSVKDLAFLGTGAKTSIAPQARVRRSLAGKGTAMAVADAQPGLVIDYRVVSTLLLNVNFGDPIDGFYGFAHKPGQDYWNGVQTPWQTSGVFPNLKWSDGATGSGIQLTLENASGVWGNNTGNPMMDSYVYPGVYGQNIVARLNNIPAGYYDFYIYGAWGGVGQVNGNYVLSVGGQGQGQKQTVLGPSWAYFGWTEGEHYAAYLNILVGSGQEVAITAFSGGNVALFNGLQMVANGSVNTPPTISNIPDQSVTVGAAAVPISFTIGDAETAAGSLTVTATSGNVTLVPASGLVLAGSGSSRTITVTPAASQTGSAIITVTVSDGNAQASDTFVLNVTASAGYTEISKSLMSADASSYFPASHPWAGGWDWSANRVIDGLYSSDPCWHSAPDYYPASGQWVRVNLGSSYNVGKVKYYPRAGAYNGSFLSYRIFVTPSSSTDPNQWGAPVAEGTWSWPTGAGFRELEFTPKQGNYVVFQCMAGVADWAAAGEVWIYQAAQGTPTPGLTVSFDGDHSIATVTGNSSLGNQYIHYTKALGVVDPPDPVETDSTVAPTLDAPGIVRARVFASGYPPSPVARAQVIGTANVTFSPSGHSPIEYATGPINVTLNAESGSTVFWRPGTSGSWGSVTSGSSPSIDGIDDGNGTITAYAYTAAKLRSTITTNGGYSFRLVQPTESVSYNAAHTQGTITLTGTGTSIRYTTDGSVPTATTGTAYTGPFSLSSETKVYAAAFKNG